MGAFDDLLPGGAQPSGAFDDLVPKAKPQGAGAFLANQAKGAFYGGVRAAGATLQAPSERSGDKPGVMANVGKSMEQYGTEGLKDVDQNAPSEGHGMLTRAAGAVMRTVGGAIPLLAASTVGAEAGGVVGGAAGSVVPGVGNAVGAVGGAMVGGALGGAGQAKLETWHDTYRQALDELTAKGDPAADTKARAYADTSSNAAAAGMGVFGAIGGGVGRVGSKIAGALGKVAATPLEAASGVVGKTVLPEFVKGGAEMMAANQIVGAGGAAAQAQINREQGIGSQATPWEAVKSGAAETLAGGAAFLPFALHGAMRVVGQSKAIASAMGDPTVPDKSRALAAQQIVSAIRKVDPETADAYAAYAQDAIDSKQPITLDVLRPPEPVPPVTDAPPVEPAMGGNTTQTPEEFAAEQKARGEAMQRQAEIDHTMNPRPVAENQQTWVPPEQPQTREEFFKEQARNQGDMWIKQSKAKREAAYQASVQAHNYAQQEAALNNQIAIDSAPSDLEIPEPPTQLTVGEQSGVPTGFGDFSERTDLWDAERADKNNRVDDLLNTQAMRRESNLESANGRVEGAQLAATQAARQAALDKFGTMRNDKFLDQFAEAFPNQPNLTPDEKMQVMRRAQAHGLKREYPPLSSTPNEMDVAALVPERKPQPNTPLTNAATVATEQATTRESPAAQPSATTEPHIRAEVNEQQRIVDNIALPMSKRNVARQRIEKLTAPSETKDNAATDKPAVVATDKPAVVATDKPDNTGSDAMSIETRRRELENAQQLLAKTPNSPLRKALVEQAQAKLDDEPRDEQSAEPAKTVEPAAPPTTEPVPAEVMKDYQEPTVEATPAAASGETKQPVPVEPAPTSSLASIVAKRESEIDQENAKYEQTKTELGRELAALDSKVTPVRNKKDKAAAINERAAEARRANTDNVREILSRYDSQIKTHPEEIARRAESSRKTQEMKAEMAKEIEPVAPAIDAPTEPGQKYDLQQIGATSGEWKTVQRYETQSEADAALPKGSGWRVRPTPPTDKQPVPVTPLRTHAEALIKRANLVDQTVPGLADKVRDTLRTGEGSSREFAKAAMKFPEGSELRDALMGIATELKGKPERAAPTASTERPLTVGLKAKGGALNTEPVTVRDGQVHIGDEPIHDLETDEPVRVPEGATNAQIIDALTKAQALTDKQRFYGGDAALKSTDITATRAPDNPHTPDTLRTALAAQVPEMRALLDSGTAHVITADQASAILGERAKPGDKAFFNPEDGTTYFIADHLDATGDLRGLVKHEVAVHAYQLGRTGPEFQDILRQVEVMRKTGNAAVREAFAAVPETVGKDGKAEEALALLVEAHPELGIVKRVVAWMRNALRAIGWKAPLSVNDLLYMAHSAMRGGEVAGREAGAASILRSSTIRAQDGYRITKDPTREQAANLLERSKDNNLRGLRDPEGKLHIWDAHDATHDQVAVELGLPNKGFNVERLEFNREQLDNLPHGVFSGEPGYGKVYGGRDKFGGKSTTAPDGTVVADAKLAPGEFDEMFGPARAMHSRSTDTALERIRAATESVKTSDAMKGVAEGIDGLKRVAGPQYRTASAREVGRVINEAMGRNELFKQRTMSELDAAVKENERATTVGGKLRDWIQKGITSKADRLFVGVSKEENYKFMQAMDSADKSYLDANPDKAAVADVMRKMWSDLAAQVTALDTGALEHLRQDYFAHMWKSKIPDEVQKQIFAKIAKRPLEGGKTFDNSRVFEDFQAGLDAGYEPISDNPMDIVALSMHEMQKYIMAHTVLKAAEAAKDGSVVLLRAGEKAPAGMTDVNGRYSTITRRTPISEDALAKKLIGQGMDRDEAWAEVKRTAAAGPLTVPESFRYVARDDVAQVVNNYLSQSLYHNKYVGKMFTTYMGAANTLNQFQLGAFSAFHAGFTSLEAIISHASIGVKAATAGDWKGAAKYLGEAPMAWYNNPKLGNKIMQAIMDSKMAPEGSEMAHILEGIQMAGFKIGMDKRFRTDSTKKMLDSWANGKPVAAAAHSISAVVEQSARPILEYLVPRQKLGVFGEMYKKWMSDNPNATHDELRNSAQQIWNRVDSRLGQVVYDRLFVHNVAKNLGQMLIRAPGWTGGTILEVGGGFKDLAGYAKALATGKKPPAISDRAAYTLSMLMVTSLTNAALTMAFTGDAPDDWKDLLAFRTGNVDEAGRPERFMLPTYAKDVYAYSQAPATTLGHKAHPILSLADDVLSNRDYYGTEIRSEDDGILTQLMQTAGYTAKAFVPFWVKGVQKEADREGSAVTMAAPLVGIMPAPSAMNRTSAEKLMGEYGADRLPKGTRTQVEQAKKEVRDQIFLALRKGERDKAQELFQQAKSDGLMTPHEFQLVTHASHKDQAVNSFKKLTFDQATRVMAAASDEERSKFAQPMLKKQMEERRRLASMGQAGG